MEETTQTTRRFPVIAMILAAVAVIAVLGFLTGTFSFTPKEEESPIIAITATPSPEPSSPPRITPEGATSAEEGAPRTPAVAGVQTSAPTGPLDFALLLFGGVAALGFGGNLLLAKFA